MTGDEFAAAAIALLGSAVGWQSAIARRLRVNPRRVREWLARGETPAWVDQAITEQMGGISAAPWPRDEWIIGDGVTADGRAREYIVHTAPPRFVARIVMCGADGAPVREEQPAGASSGVVYWADPDTLLAEIEWIDQPAPGEVTGLLEAAADAIEEMGDRDLAQRDGGP